MRPPVPQGDFADADLRRHGCTVAGITYLARQATNGDAWSDPDDYAAAIRRASGTSLADFRKRGTTMREAETAYDNAPGFAGRVRPVMDLYRGGSIRNDLLPALKDGKTWAGVAVRYGVVQKAGRGVGSFQEGHFVVVGEPEGSSLTVADPLRRQLVTWSVVLLEEAAEKFGDDPWLNGRGEFGIVSYAPTILELRTQQRDAARAALAAAKRSGEQLTNQVRTLAVANRTLVGELDTAKARIAGLEASPAGTERALLDKAFLLDIKTPDALQSVFDRANAGQQALVDERGRVIDSIIDHAGSLR